MISKTEEVLLNMIRKYALIIKNLVDELQKPTVTVIGTRDLDDLEFTISQLKSHFVTLDDIVHNGE